MLVVGNYTFSISRCYKCEIIGLLMTEDTFQIFFVEYMHFLKTNLNIPLTTNAIFLSDLSETFFSDSSNFLKNKVFLHGFFFLQWLLRYWIFSIFRIFNSEGLFSSRIIRIIFMISITVQEI